MRPSGAKSAASHPAGPVARSLHSCYVSHLMHIPDGFLSAPVWGALDVVSLPAVVYMARRAQREVEESRVPLLGVMGAFVFAAQMINFPVGLGTSGHLVGGALLAVTLGPAAATVVMTAILAVQALVFQDGGLLALGANVFNMAIVGVAAAYLPYRFWGSGRWRKAGILAGSMLSVFVSAALAITELILSGVPIRAPVLGVSLGLFFITALLEGLITLAVVESVTKINPGWIQAPASGNRPALGVLSTAAALLAAVGVLFASAHPDGLEKLAETVGIAAQAKALMTSPLADYEARFLGPAWLRKATAGLAGLALIFAVCVVLGRWIARQRSA